MLSKQKVKVLYRHINTANDVLAQFVSWGSARQLFSIALGIVYPLLKSAGVENCVGNCSARGCGEYLIKHILHRNVATTIGCAKLNREIE